MYARAECARRDVCVRPTRRVARPARRYVHYRSRSAGSAVTHAARPRTSRGTAAPPVPLSGSGESRTAFGGPTMNGLRSDRASSNSARLSILNIAIKSSRANSDLDRAPGSARSSYRQILQVTADRTAKSREIARAGLNPACVSSRRIEHRVIDGPRRSPRQFSREGIDRERSRGSCICCVGGIAIFGSFAARERGPPMKKSGNFPAGTAGILLTRYF